MIPQPGGQAGSAWWTRSPSPYTAVSSNPTTSTRKRDERPAERAAVIDHNVHAFCLTSDNLRARDVAALNLAVLDQLGACGEPGPFLFTVSRAGLRRIDADN
jgi:hypothetical protein